MYCIHIYDTHSQERRGRARQANRVVLPLCEGPQQKRPHSFYPRTHSGDAVCVIQSFTRKERHCEFEIAPRVLLKSAASNVAGFTTSAVHRWFTLFCVLSFRVWTLSCWCELCGLIKPILILVCSRTSFMCHVEMQRRYLQPRL